jgi:ABC-type sugar transport system substrate-binding protein
VLVGPNAADLAPLLIRRRTVNPELVIYGHACTPDMVAAIDAGVGTGGRLRGCVDTNPAGAARLASEVLVRLAGGAAVAEVNGVQVIPYEPGFRG